MNREAAPIAWLELSDGAAFSLLGDCSIGRLPDNALVMDDGKVSRHHALIQHRDNNEFWLIDLGSSNGTFVNHRRVRSPVLLQEGDNLFVGDFCLHFHQVIGTHSAQRQQSTVFLVKSMKTWLLVTDIVGSSQLHKRLPLDEARERIHAWMVGARSLVERHGGVVNQFLGDGVFAYWPDATANVGDVSHALADFEGLRAEGGLPFRLVLHYGEVLTGGSTLGEENLHGPAVNFAFRMEYLAKNLGESCLISEPAAQRLGGELATEVVGHFAVPGFEETVRFHRYPPL